MKSRIGNGFGSFDIFSDGEARITVPTFHLLLCISPGIRTSMQSGKCIMIGK